jgi:hydroxyacylglutathione hydrolase
MHQSLSRLAALPGATRVYCTHEYTLSNLRFAHAVEPHNPDVSARLAEVARWRDEGHISLPSNIELELATNPFLRVGEPAVVAATNGRDDRQSSEPSAVFASLRAWKDRF